SEDWRKQRSHPDRADESDDEERTDHEDEREGRCTKINSVEGPGTKLILEPHCIDPTLERPSESQALLARKQSPLAESDADVHLPSDETEKWCDSGYDSPPPGTVRRLANPADDLPDE